MGASVAQADQATVEADSAAHGHFVWLEGLGLDVAGGASTSTEFDAAPGPATDPLNVELLGAVDLDLGGITLPLLTDGTEPGLLNLGNAGAISSHSTSPSDTESTAASGLITAEGAIDLDAANDPEFQPASLDFTALLGQLGLDGLTDQVLDEASLELGAIASQAEKNGADQTSAYMLSNAELSLHSPAVDDVVGAVDGATGSVGTALDGLVGEGGAITSVVQTAVDALDALPVPGLEVSLNSLGLDTTGLVDSVREELLQTPINNAATADGASSVNIDLSTGTIYVNLEEVLTGPGGVYEGLTLSTLPENTDLLSDDVLNSIVAGVTDALTGTGPNSLTTKATDLLQQGIYSLALDLNIEATAPLLGTTNITLEDSEGNAGTLGGLLGVDGYPEAGLEVTGGVLGAVGGLVTPILNTLLTGIGSAVQPIVDTAVTNLSEVLNAAIQPLVTALTGEDALFKSALDQVATVTVNAQPAEGDRGADSFTVRALSVSVLPQVLGENAVNLELASSTVKALDEAAATLTATPNPVNQGDDVTLTGGGFEPGETVTITLPDGTTTEVTAEDDGSFTTTWTVPEDYAPGDAEFTAVGNDSGLTATAVTVVQDADAEADANVNASASASASADAAADDDATASAQAAAQAAADEDANSTASAAADVSANSAASVAANADASTAASAESNAAASAASQASADSTADSAQDADASAEASAAANADARAAAAASAEAAAESNASTDASSAASANVNADADSSAAAEASADNNSSASASAAADNDATAAAAASADSNGNDGNLSNTGAANLTMMGVAAAVLLLLGAGVVALQRYRSRLTQ